VQTECKEPQEKKFGADTVEAGMSALRFFSKKVLRRHDVRFVKSGTVRNFSKMESVAGWSPCNRQALAEVSSLSAVVWFRAAIQSLRQLTGRYRN